MATARVIAAATALADGTHLVAGGTNFDGILASAEIYDPATGNFSRRDSQHLSLANHLRRRLHSCITAQAVGAVRGPCIARNPPLHLTVIRFQELWRWA